MMLVSVFLSNGWIMPKAIHQGIVEFVLVPTQTILLSRDELGRVNETS